MKFLERWKKKPHPQESQVTQVSSISEHYEYLSDGHAAYIKDLVMRAGNVDSGRKVFGSASHKYQLNPVISPAEIRQHEERYRVTLPEEYKFFMTKVGNGGAGPYYGIYPLDKIEQYHEYIEESGKPAWIGDALTPEIWAGKMALLDNDDDDTYDQIMKEITSGFQVIGTQGCTFDNLLMNSGSEKGRMVYIDWNLISENVPCLTGMTFLEWYENFFQEIVNGNTVNSYGYVRLGTEQELMTAFKQAEIKDRRRILISFFRFMKVSEETVRFLQNIDDKVSDDIRVELLFRFDLKSGIALFETLLNGANPEAAIMSARRMPEDRFDQYYNKMLHLLYHFEPLQIQENGSSVRDKLLFFLSDCGSLRAKDLVDFISSPGTAEEERKTAIYVMGKAVDKDNYLDYFISYMKDDSLWISHAALQAVARVVNPKLVETYEWMWEKYQHNSMMRSNLIIAFGKNGIKKE